ncbi:MAG: membrane integrity-associated transporter subunit PqiC [Acidobacteriota bacterium]
MFTRANALAVTLAALALTAPFLGGCGKSAPTRFYTLAPQTIGQDPAGQEARGDNAAPGRPCPSLGIGPVDFPAYLDRNQIVTRSGSHQMTVADFDQWIEPLQDNFKRTLLADLAGVTCAKPLVLFPWPAGLRPDYQVSIQVRRFDGTLGGEAVLQADWSVQDAAGQAVAWRTSQFKETPGGPDYAQLASAQSRLVARLAQDIAAAVSKLKP